LRSTFIFNSKQFDIFVQYLFAKFLLLQISN